jgi:hypothetical protein
MELTANVAKVDVDYLELPYSLEVLVDLQV